MSAPEQPRSYCRHRPGDVCGCSRLLDAPRARRLWSRRPEWRCVSCRARWQRLQPHGPARRTSQQPELSWTVCLQARSTAGLACISLGSGAGPPAGTTASGYQREAKVCKSGSSRTAHTWVVLSHAGTIAEPACSRRRESTQALNVPSLAACFPTSFAAIAVSQQPHSSNRPALVQLLG